MSEQFEEFSRRIIALCGHELEPADLTDLENLSGRLDVCYVCAEAGLTVMSVLGIRQVLHAAGVEWSGMLFTTKDLVLFQDTFQRHLAMTQSGISLVKPKH